MVRDIRGVVLELVEGAVSSLWHLPEGFQGLGGGSVGGPDGTCVEALMALVAPGGWHLSCFRLCQMMGAVCFRNVLAP